jgi:DNA-binding NtrC family response regulator
MVLPIVQILPHMPMALPLVAPVGTVVLHDVDKLDRSGQLYLLGWLDLSVGRPRVISTSSASLLPVVEAGAFLAALYYRLNLLYVRC